MTALLSIGVEGSALERAAVDVLVVPFFASDRPLRGPAALLDWRLCGLLSEVLSAGRVQGARGDAVLLTSGGALRAPRLLALGLGSRPGFGADDLRAVAREAVERGAALGVRILGFALPSEEAGLGMALERAAEVWLEGAASGAAGLPEPPSLRIVVDEGRAQAARRGLLEAAERIRSADQPLCWARSESLPSSRRPGSLGSSKRGGSSRGTSRPAPTRA